MKKAGLSLLMLFAVACGGGGGDDFAKLSDPFPGLASRTDFGAEVTDAEQTAGATTAVQSTMTMATASENPGLAAGSLTTAYTGPQAMLGGEGAFGANIAEKAQNKLLRQVFQFAANPGPLNADFDECATIVETGEGSFLITIECSETDEDGTTLSMTGTISIVSDGTTVTISIQVSLDAELGQEGVSFSIHAAFLTPEGHDLVFSETAISGGLAFLAEFDISAEGQSAHLEILAMELFDLALSGPECVSGGTLSAEMTIEGSGGGESISYHRAGQATFMEGGCNDLESLHVIEL